MNAYSANGVSRAERRYWRRRNTANRWWPAGILPLAGLLFLFLFGLFQTAPAIEEQTRDSVVQTLESQGIGLRHVDVDGRRIRIDAAAGQYDEETIRALAENAQCQTWAGKLVCPSVVEVSLSDEVSAPMVEADSKPEPAPELRFHNFEFSRQNGDVTLTGEVADEQMRSEIVSQARTRFTRVIDRLAISGDTAMPQYRAATVRALDTLQSLMSGSASWSDGSFSATGEVSPEKEAALQALVAGGGLPLGEVSFRTVRSAAICNEEFAAALQQSNINFRSGSAEIQDTSTVLLKRLANLAGQCPGTLLIAGHTDNVGDAGLNLRLSESRAAAVRDALAELGVVSERLSARGYGESRPVADNGTREGRAKNRRISIHLSGTN